MIMSIVNFKTATKKTRKIIGRIASIWWAVSFFILIFSLIPISHKIDNMQQQLNQQDAQSTLMLYFSYIELGKFNKAFDLFSQEKKYNQTFSGFSEWLHNLVAFEWLRITPLPEKDSAIKKAFLAEFWFKERWKKAVDIKQWFTLEFIDKEWKIDYSTNNLYEKWRKDWACDFYHFDHCK